MLKMLVSPPDVQCKVRQELATIIVLADESDLEATCAKVKNLCPQDIEAAAKYGLLGRGGAAAAGRGGKRERERERKIERDRERERGRDRERYRTR